MAKAIASTAADARPVISSRDDRIGSSGDFYDNDRERVCCVYPFTPNNHHSFNYIFILFCSQSQPKNQCVNGTLAKNMTHIVRVTKTDRKKTRIMYVRAMITVNLNGTEIEMIGDGVHHLKSARYLRHHRPVENSAKKKTIHLYDCSTIYSERQKRLRASIGCH